MTDQYLSRDISWLSFNARVLQEAARPGVPIFERFRFLSIFSSNLDEFYRVRMSPVLLINNLPSAHAAANPGFMLQVQGIIQKQQENFGNLLNNDLLPALRQKGIHLIYREPIPEEIEPALKDYFQTTVRAFLNIRYPEKKRTGFFPESNHLYLAVACENKQSQTELIIINIPSNHIPRFFTRSKSGKQYIVFLDDTIRQYLPLLLPGKKITGSWNIKITRDAELDLADEYAGDLAEKIERQLAKRDKGIATRFLYEQGFPAQHLYALLNTLQLPDATLIAGGGYHNLKDLSGLPINDVNMNYLPMPAILPAFYPADSILSAVEKADCIIHTPYQAYETVLRFFNEAATNASIQEIYTTLYRVANDSKIVHALITAAENGKQVTVFIELKARFDEENNIRWSKRMKAAGIRIINSIPGLKVHAKIALVKRKHGDRFQYYGLMATGNLNETTARFYTDHILLTIHPGIARELELLFIFLIKRRKPANTGEINFNHLLVAQFNLLDGFLALIDREIDQAKAGRPAGIIIKINNLEERVLIRKLYEAAAAGVQVRLLVRSICCLNPDFPVTGSAIIATRIVDRYLEHGRVFIFTNAGDEKIFLGSADWMNRNVYRRIEVCFPVYDAAIKNEIRHMINLQLSDNTQAVHLSAALDNQPVQNNDPAVQSQPAIYAFLNKNGAH